MIRNWLAAALLSGVSFCSASAQEQSGAPEVSIDSLSALIGDWRLTIEYANGAVAEGTRICAPALGGGYIRCDSDVRFDDDDATRRESVNYINYNARRGVFEDVAMWQFPAAKKIMDLSGDPAGELVSRGYIYSGEASPARRVMEIWSISDKEAAIIVKSNIVSQRADEWPVFLTEKMIRKK